MPLKTAEFAGCAAIALGLSLGAPVAAEQPIQDRLRPDQIDYRRVNSEYRRVMRIRPDERFVRTFSPADFDPGGIVRFYLHPTSGPFQVVGLEGAETIPAKLIGLEPLDGDWRWGRIVYRMTAPVEEELRFVIYGDPSDTSNPEWPIVTAPMSVHRASDRRPPVFLICIDGLSADRLPIYGYRRGKTPHLSAFAQQATVYDGAVAPTSTCLPAQVSLMTGRAPEGHGVGDFDRKAFRPFPAEVPTLASVLGDAGYVTECIHGSTDFPGHIFFPYFQAFFEYAGREDPESEIEANRAIALDWLREHRGEAVFLFFHTDVIRRTRGASTYDRGVARADALLGDIFSELRRLDLFDSALIVVTADHGGFERGRKDQNLHVPLLVKRPGQKKSAQTRRVKTPVRTIDVLPTILGILNIPEPPGLDGTSAPSGN
ncbi:sulfatase [bacterium]|nr:sulfatase [bacterium]